MTGSHKCAVWKKILIEVAGVFRYVIRLNFKHWQDLDRGVSGIVKISHFSQRQMRFQEIINTPVKYE